MKGTFLKPSHTYNPILYFTATFGITWLLWIPAAIMSWSGNNELVPGALLGLGLLGPLAGSAILLAKARDRELTRDFANRLLDLRRIRPASLPFIILLIPAVMVVSILLSPIIGQSLEQLSLTAEFHIMEGSPLLSFVIPILAPALEELGWSGYGIDSLKSRFNLFRTSLLFGALWAVWHLPLFFVQGYYHHSLSVNAVYVVNFFVSVIPMTFLTNWLYFRNNRSIPGAIAFHVVTVVSAEMFMVTNQTKCIVTIVLSAIAALLVCVDRDVFFAGDTQRSETSSRAFGKRAA